VNHQLYQWVRVSENRDSSPNAAIFDSQAVKTATPAVIEAGYDAVRKVKGCKRHLLVDTLGLVLMIVFTQVQNSFWRNLNTFDTGSVG
jgi:putative transposase